ncbi:MAG: aldo/keto reductase [Pirellulales bacterium]|nr:aldo/keto reductase [Pirellulales bacterium]
MSTINRRNFLAATAGASTLLGGLKAENVVAAEPIARPPMIELGKTGIKMSRLGQGTGMRGGNRQSNHTRLGFEKLVGLMRHGYERGVTFFDLADLYGTHIYFREALRTIPRDKVTVLTKLWFRYDGRNPRDVLEDFKKRSTTMAVERFCHEVATDHMDIVLLHCLQSGNWIDEMGGYMEALADAKKKGKIRAVGISCHTIDALRAGADCDWVDVVLARINPKGNKMDDKPEKIIPILKKYKQNGKAVIGMKIYGEGTLLDQKDECMKFAQGLGLLDAMTIGSESIEQLDENLKLMAKYPAARILQPNS